MKTSPIRPAQIAFGDPPRSTTFGDVYHPAVGAAAQAQHVFLAGNGLPARWAGLRSFSILETGFGLGNNFLATWGVWRDDPLRCGQLVFVSIEAHPPSRTDLERAHAGSPVLARALADRWPPSVPGLQVLNFDDGRVQLHLALGDVRAMMAELRGSIDAFYLDGFAPRLNPAMWDRGVIHAAARRAAPGATAASWCVAREVREALQASGFDVQRRPGLGGKRQMLVARYAPSYVPRRAALEEARPAAETATVIGGGLAGAWAARSLARRGVRVTVFDRHEAPAGGASGNPAGLFHATLHADDGVHARLHRAAALLAWRELRPWIASGEVPGAADGLLRIETAPGALAAMRAQVASQGLPEDHVRALDPAACSALAGVELGHPAWWFAAAGWVDPRALVAQLLREPRVTWLGGRMVAALARNGDGWQTLAEDGTVLDSADCVVIACAEEAPRLAAPYGVADWPIERVRGQVSWWRERPGATPTLPVAGDGYAIGLPDGGLLCGATAHSGDDAGDARASDHVFNVQRLARLTGITPSPGATWHARVGWRLRTPDRLPIAGAVAASPTPGARSDQARFVRRVPGLFVSTAFGSRGIALAALAGELVAAQACCTPWPVEADLADAIDPARWLVRAARRGTNPRAA